MQLWVELIFADNENESSPMVFRQALAFVGASLANEASGVSSPLYLGPSDFKLLDQFCAEIQAASVSCAVLMTAHSAHRCGFVFQMPREHETLVPYVPLTTGAIASSGFSKRLSASNASMLGAIPHYLSAAKSRMENVLHNDSGPAHDRFLRSVDVAIDPLRTASTFLLVTLDDLAEIADLEPQILDESALRKLRHMLQSALNGGTPLLINGEVQFPHTEITIRGMRRIVDIRAKLLSYGRAWRVRVHDVSQGGFCVVGVRGIEPGDPARLLLPSGRELVGQVRWIDNDRAGVRFNSRLLLGDPLINQ
jgi:hypothetical protein